MRHADRLADPTRFRQLDVDPVGDLAAASDVGKRVAVLVDVDRHRRTIPECRPSLVSGPQRLFAVGDAELVELRKRSECFLERPGFVHVDLQRKIRDPPHRSDALDVEAVATSELELQPAKGRRGSLGSPCHVVRVAEPDGPRCRRPRAREPEQTCGRQPEQLPLEVVQRRVECRFRGLLAGYGGKALAEVLEGERIVAEELGVLEHECLGGRRRLVVAVDRRSLPVAGGAVVRNGDVEHVSVIGRLARDDEGLGELQADDPGLDLHAGSLATLRESRSRRRTRRRRPRPGPTRAQPA